jgi:hypothetical protein
MADGVTKQVSDIGGLSQIARQFASVGRRASGEVAQDGRSRRGHDRVTGFGQRREADEFGS